MSRLNRLLAALAIAVLIGTLSLLSWLRRRADQEVERMIALTRDALPARDVLHGPGGDTLVHFSVVEAAARRALQTPYFRALCVTKLVRGEEIPILPLTLRAERGDRWREALVGWRRVALPGADGEPYGYLYLDEDRSVRRTLDWAIGSVSTAIVLMLITLLARLWSQETTLTRTMIELNERRRELIRLERLALAGQLAAGLLHDLRKPVLNIRHSLEELADALGDYAPASPALAEMQRQTRLFFQILGESQMERFVQSDRVGEEYVELSGVMDYALNLVRYERGAVEIVRRDARDAPPVLGQPFRLIQLFSNLILNAYQAMNGRGRLTIEIEPAPGGPRNQPGVRARLIDTGPGIPPALLDRIFDPFFTTKPDHQGTGLGLSICRMIVEEMGGTIAAENHPDGGACFTVWVPAAPEPADAAGEAAPRNDG